MLKLLEESKAMAKEEREKARKLEAKAVKESENLTLQVRELKVKLSTSRMREEESLRTIADLKKSIELRNANN